jgi:hypothetical protein
VKTLRLNEVTCIVKCQRKRAFEMLSSDVCGVKMTAGYRINFREAMFRFGSSVKGRVEAQADEAQDKISPRQILSFLSQHLQYIYF